MKVLNIHGDNIVECERTLNLILRGFPPKSFTVSSPTASSVCPKFTISFADQREPLQITFYPGFGRWDNDILSLVRNKGGVLREAADAIVTEVNSEEEIPLFAIEYCGALPAGNQAWQRSGRAYSFGLARIPYLYVAEIGGYELDADRKRKAPRLPNPAVPFSYVSFSESYDTLVAPIFTTSIGADAASKAKFGKVYGEVELYKIIHAFIFKLDTDTIETEIKNKALAFVTTRASDARTGTTLSPEGWNGAFSYVKKGESIISFLSKEPPIEWSKTAYIDGLTSSVKELMKLAAEHASGLTSTDLPMCIIPTADRRGFANKICELYPDLPTDFREWLKKSTPLTICWVMGFKPHGDDARPDRGLPPLARMLIGKNADLLTVVYGPAPKPTWKTLASEPSRLGEQNGLWQAIFESSDALLVDSKTDAVTRKGFIRKQWKPEEAQTHDIKILVSPSPASIGENDIDTVLHLILANFAHKQVFEGMCNPPGGDWSGISLLTKDAKQECRWLSLPRVSGEHAKRPDHVFQIFGVTDKPMILAIESKEQPESVENKIGPRLIEYLSDLLKTPPSVLRTCPAGSWEHASTKFESSGHVFCSAAAFLADEVEAIREVGERTKTDLLFGCDFSAGGKTCKVTLLPQTANGKILAKFIQGIAVEKDLLSITTINS